MIGCLLPQELPGHSVNEWRLPRLGTRENCTLVRVSCTLVQYQNGCLQWDKSESQVRKGLLASSLDRIQLRLYCLYGGQQPVNAKRFMKKADCAGA